MTWRARVHPAFAARAFIRDASSRLDELELLDRGKHIATALATHLPQAYPEAPDVLVRSLGPVHACDELLGVGMAPFFYLPHTILVAERGLDRYDLSLRAQLELTKRFTAAASIRPCVAHDPERAFENMRVGERQRRSRAPAGVGVHAPAIAMAPPFRG